MHTDLLLRRLEEQEKQHRAELSSIQDLLQRSLEKEARLAARLETLLACGAERREPSLHSTGSSALLHQPSVQDVQRLEKEVALLNEDLRSATEKNFLLANQVDLLRCAAEEAIDAAEAGHVPQDTSQWPKEATNSPTATLNAVEQELISLQTLLETETTLTYSAMYKGTDQDTHQDQTLRETETMLTPAPRPAPRLTSTTGRKEHAHLLTGNGVSSREEADEQAVPRDTTSSNPMHAHELANVQNALCKANKLLNDMCQADAAWDQHIRSTRERVRQGDLESPPQQVSVLELRQAEAKTAALWGQVQELSAENRQLSDSLRFLQTQTVMRRFQGLSMCVSPERAASSPQDAGGSSVKTASPWEAAPRTENRAVGGGGGGGAGGEEREGSRDGGGDRGGKDTAEGSLDAVPDDDFTDGIWIYRRVPGRSATANDVDDHGGGSGDGAAGGVRGSGEGAHSRGSRLEKGAGEGSQVGYSGARLSSYTKYVACKRACKKSPML